MKVTCENCKGEGNSFQYVNHNVGCSPTHARSLGLGYKRVDRDVTSHLSADGYVTTKPKKVKEIAV